MREWRTGTRAISGVQFLVGATIYGSRFTADSYIGLSARYVDKREVVIRRETEFLGVHDVQEGTSARNVWPGLHAGIKFGVNWGREP